MDDLKTTLFDAPAAIKRDKAPAARGLTVNNSTANGLTVNPSVEASQRAHLKAQAVAIYKRLLDGPVTTGELVEMAAQYNARIKELREWLYPMGWTVDKISSNTQANNRYAIKPLFGSKYQRLQMRKSARHRR